MSKPKVIHTAPVESVFNLPVKVVPGASSNSIAGWLGESLRVRVTAAPERGKANAAVESIVADALGLPKSAVRVVSGKTSARKVLAIEGLPKADAMSVLTVE
jgi:uncharacterized protein YggU (UPF0235/DUF167 family)